MRAPAPKSAASIVVSTRWRASRYVKWVLARVWGAASTREAVTRAIVAPTRINRGLRRLTHSVANKRNDALSRLSCVKIRYTPYLPNSFIQALSAEGAFPHSFFLRFSCSFFLSLSPCLTLSLSLSLSGESAV